MSRMSKRNLDKKTKHRWTDMGIYPVEQSGIQIPQAVLDMVAQFDRRLELLREEVSEQIKHGKVHPSVLDRVPRIQLADIFDVFTRGLWSEKLGEIIDIHLIRPLENSLEAIEEGVEYEPVAEQELIGDQYARQVMASSKKLLGDMRAAFDLAIEAAVSTRKVVVNRIQAIRDLLLRCNRQSRLVISAETSVNQQDSLLAELIRKTGSDLSARKETEFATDAQIQARCEKLQSIRDQLQAATERLGDSRQQALNLLQQVQSDREALRGEYATWEKVAERLHIYRELFDECGVQFWRFVKGDESVLADPRNSSAWQDAMAIMPEPLPSPHSSRALSLVDVVLAELQSLAMRQSFVADPPPLNEKEKTSPKDMDPVRLAVCALGWAGKLHPDNIPTLKEVWDALVDADLTCGISRREFDHIVCDTERGRSFLMAGINRFRVVPKVLEKATIEKWGQDLPENFFARLKEALQGEVLREPVRPSPPPPINPAETASAELWQTTDHVEVKHLENLEPWQVAVVIIDLLSPDDYQSLRAPYATYRDILAPSGYTFGLTKEDFLGAVKVGIQRQLLYYKKKGDSQCNFCGPTQAGRQLAERLRHCLPSDVVAYLQEAPAKVRALKKAKKEQWRRNRGQ